MEKAAIDDTAPGSLSEAKLDRNAAENSPEPSSGRSNISRWIAGATLLAVVLLFAAIRWRLRDAPLERDEGEYAYAGQLMLQGVPPYQLAYNMKLPGTYAAYAAMMRIFGETAAGIHTGVLLLNACTTLLLYFVGRRLYGRLGGVAAAAAYALLSSSEAVLGLCGHATHFVTLMAVPGILLLLMARKQRSVMPYFAAGLCMGLAFVMKQPGAVFIAFGLQEILWRAWREEPEKKRIVVQICAYGGGAALPYLLTCAWLWRTGVFGKFWFWTVSYASQYAAATGVREGAQNFAKMVPQLFWASPLVWVLAALGVWIALRAERAKALLGLECSLFFWSFLGASAGLYYRDHYFIVMLPAVCLLATKALTWITNELAAAKRRKVLIALPSAVFALTLGLGVYAQRKIFFELSPAGVMRFEYGGNPFPEAIEFGKYIREHSDAQARIGILGSEPELCFYAQRHSATGYIYMYPLMEGQKYAATMQQEMIDEIEANKPEYMVLVLVPASWLRKPNSDLRILEWGDKYLADDYRIVGVADISYQTTYKWDLDAVGYVPHSRYSMYLYKRKI